jgi:hypothetical protein
MEYSIVKHEENVKIILFVRFFLQHPANPDLLYIIFFCHSQLTITILLCLIFASKVFIQDKFRLIR